MVWISAFLVQLPASTTRSRGWAALRSLDPRVPLRESIIDNYEGRSPAWPSFVAPEGLSFYEVPATDPDGHGYAGAVVLNGDDEGYT